MSRFTVAAAFLAVVRGAQASAAAGWRPTEAEMQEMWTQFQLKFARSYPDEAQTQRYGNFRTNVLQAAEMNAEQGVHCTDLFDGPTCVFGITKFSDLSEKEFRTTHLGYKPKGHKGEFKVLEDLPAASNSTVDWRPKGAVTPVKDQGQCGSCWAFSATEEIESAVFMATGKLVPLSTQQIISCDKVDEGCNGGDTVSAYQYVQKAGGLDDASDYPDKSHVSGRTGKCSWDKDVDAKVTGFTYATKPCKSGSCAHQDEDQLAAALLAKGPISICVNAGGAGWQSYQRGIFSKTCSGAASELDHCVQLVGYDKSGSTPYWIVRNSWNSDWGIDGYMHIKMGKNLCGVADEATIVQATGAGLTVSI